VQWFTKARRAQSNTDDETWAEGGVTPTLNAFDNGDVRATVVVITDDGTARRLTPVEYERLQGFPDNWTDTSQVTETLWGEEVHIGPESQRFTQMGNAVTVPVAKYLGTLLPSA
jgi:DNA (cytosine-5)-methyltransferase 1